MAFQKYDFVGVSTKQLPYIHDSFPASQKLGTIRYCTMRSMHRGKDAKRKNELDLKERSILKNDIKELVDLKLPKLDINSHGYEKTNSMSPRLHGGNIYKQKAYFRLKGIPIRKLYTINRTKTDKFEDGNSGLNNSIKKKSASLTFLDLKEVESKVADDSTAEDSEYSLLENLDSPWTRCRMRELDSESPIPGFKSRRVRKGRKLGNVVSSRRLQQLLDNEDTLDPCTFYMY